MHPLLKRQLRKFFPDATGFEPGFEQFIRAVDAAYLAVDEDRLQLERSLHLASDELVERNQRLKNELLPPLDMAVGSLLDDLVERNLFERTLVVIMGEFGRAPKITPVNDPSMPITFIPGRTHWPFCYSVFMAGGGVKPGYVYGASDNIGAYPIDKPVIPADVIATIYEALGIPNTFEFRDSANRPYPLVPWGEPILEMLT